MTAFETAWDLAKEDCYWCDKDLTSIGVRQNYLMNRGTNRFPPPCPECRLIMTEGPPDKIKIGEHEQKNPIFTTGEPIAFDTAWSLLKEWTPDWRQKIDALPLIDEANDFDFNFNWEDRDAVKNARMQSNYYLPKDIVPFVHPHSDSFVAKRPGSGDFEGEEPIYRNIMRMRANPFNVALEELGYPVVSEMHREGDGFFNIQPRLITGPGEHWKKVDEQPPYKRPGLAALAQRVLDGIATDKHGDNIGIDPKGLPRFFDYNLQGGPWSVGFDNYSKKTKKERAEDWMGRTHTMGLELPVSRLIDRLPDMTDIRGLEDDGFWMENDMDELRANQEGIREFLELIEPHSRHSTKEVTHDGKAIWGSDWNSLDPR